MKWRKVFAWDTPYDFMVGDTIELTKAQPSHTGLLPAGLKGVVTWGETSYAAPLCPLSVAFTHPDNPRFPVHESAVDPENLKLVSHEPLPFVVGRHIALKDYMTVANPEEGRSSVHPGDTGVLSAQDPVPGMWTVSLMVSSGYHVTAHLNEEDMVVIWPIP